MKPEKMIAKGRLLLDKYGLRDWQLTIETLEDRPDLPLGLCDSDNRVIRIDRRVGREFRQVVLHEIAHALRGGPNHDPEWIKIAKRIGCTSNHLMPYAVQFD